MKSMSRKRVESDLPSDSRAAKRVSETVCPFGGLWCISRVGDMLRRTITSDRCPNSVPAATPRT